VKLEIVDRFPIFQPFDFFVLKIWSQSFKWFWNFLDCSLHLFSRYCEVIISINLYFDICSVISYPVQRNSRLKSKLFEMNMIAPSKMSHFDPAFPLCCHILNELSRRRFPGFVRFNWQFLSWLGLIWRFTSSMKSQRNWKGIRYKQSTEQKLTFSKDFQLAWMAKNLRVEQEEIMNVSVEVLLPDHPPKETWGDMWGN
jgi:hypothetical protein